jgi:uncharacterized protein (DUF1800 family)
MARPAPLLDHLYRRAGFGLAPSEWAAPAERTYRENVDALLVFDESTVDVDGLIGRPGYAGITSAGPFNPNRDINHARQRWLFRMVHSPAPLRERMALVWHHHFATAYIKIAGIYGGADAARMLDAKPTDDPVGQMGQIELFRRRALGRFEDLLVEVAKDPAMLVWLDGRQNVRNRPQENFGRELMELFTFGVEHYTEADVYAAARVFTGWNLRVSSNDRTGGAAYTFQYNAGQHDTGPKEFSFPIYRTRGAGASRRIPERSAAEGIQDGVDLIHALAVHPETANRLARRLWTWFVSEIDPPDEAFVQSISRVYLENGTSMRAVMRAVLMSPQFRDPRRFHQRYAWPVEFIVRSLKEVGRAGFSVNDALSPLVNMGQQLYEPPDVNGWELGPAWFTTGAMLARMNFASQLVTNQRVALREAARGSTASPESLIDFVYGALSLPAGADDLRATLGDYVRAGGEWTGSDSQVLAKAAGLFHLLCGSGEYQFV